MEEERIQKFLDLILNEHYCEDCNELCSTGEVFPLEFVAKYIIKLKEDNKDLNKVLIHFKAVINEMAKYINNKNNGDIYDLVCARECKNEKCRMSEGDNKYQELECIKEYFSKKAQK